MKPTNYHLFDFLDFDIELSKPESLWKACKPTAVEERDGDLYVTVPFQKQLLANDMAPDNDTPRESHTLILRQYGPKILRVFMGFGEVEISDCSEMLMLNERVGKLPLTVRFEDGLWIIATKREGETRAVINVREPELDRWSELLPDPQETIDLRLYPDGEHEVRLAAYDHFSPPRYDALPIAYCKLKGELGRATLSFSF